MIGAYAVYLAATFSLIPLFVVFVIVARLFPRRHFGPMVPLSGVLFLYLGGETLVRYLTGRGADVAIVRSVWIATEATLPAIIPPYLWLLERLFRTPRWTTTFHRVAMGGAAVLVVAMAASPLFAPALTPTVTQTRDIILALLVLYGFGITAVTRPRRERFDSRGLIRVGVVVALLAAAADLGWMLAEVRLVRPDLPIARFPLGVTSMMLSVGAQIMVDFVASASRAQHATASLREEEQRLLRMPTTDRLTDLGNRRLLLQDLTLPFTGERTLQFVDIDLFRIVNEAYGRARADDVLREIGLRLAAMAATRAAVYRIGGDRFALVWHADSGVDLAEQSSVLETIRAPLRAISPPISLSASVGETLVDRTMSPDEMLTRAEVALRIAKERRNTLRRYTGDLDQRTRRRAAVGSALTHAAPDEFTVIYEPVIDREGHHVGDEVRLRWRNPILGDVAPEEFFQIAEADGSVSRLYDLMARRVAQTIDGRRRTHPGHSLHVDLSPRLLEQANVPAIVADWLGQWSLEPSHLALELPEQAFAGGTPLVVEVTNALASAGYRVMLDAFGAGSTTLAYLTTLPIRGVKLDAEFTRRVVGDSRTATLLRGIARVAHAMAVHVYAVDVVDRTTADALVDCGIDRLQGPITTGSEL